MWTVLSTRVKWLRSSRSKANSVVAGRSTFVDKFLQRNLSLRVKLLTGVTLITCVLFPSARRLCSRALILR